MAPETTADLLEGGLQCCLGVWMTLVAYGVIGARLRARIPILHTRHAVLVKIGGLVLIALGLTQAVTSLKRRPASTAKVWQRVSTSDGACSIEFPQAPEREVKVIAGLPTETRTLYLEGSDENFRLSSVELPADAPAASDEHRLDEIRSSMIALLRASDQRYELVKELQFSEDGFAGRELQFVVDGKHAMRARLYLSGRREYRAIVVTPKDGFDEDARHFLESVRFTP